MPEVNSLKLGLPSLHHQNFRDTSKALTQLYVREIKKNIGSTIFSSLSSIALFESPMAASEAIFGFIRALALSPE